MNDYTGLGGNENPFPQLTHEETRTSFPAVGICFSLCFPYCLSLQRSLKNEFYRSCVLCPLGLSPSLGGVPNASLLVCGLDLDLHAAFPQHPSGKNLCCKSFRYSIFLALHPYEIVLMELQQWLEDHHPAGPGTSSSKVGCVSMVSVGEPWGRAHASAEEVGGRIPSVGAQAPKRL